MTPDEQQVSSEEQPAEQQPESAAAQQQGESLPPAVAEPAASADTPLDAQPDAQPGADAEQPGPEQAPAKRAPRKAAKKATKKTAKKATAKKAAPAEDEQPAEQTAEQAGADAPAGAQSGPQTDAATQPAEGEVAAEQAQEPSRPARRSRRATAKAAAPVHVPAQDEAGATAPSAESDPQQNPAQNPQDQLAGDIDPVTELLVDEAVNLANQLAQVREADAEQAVAQVGSTGFVVPMDALEEEVIDELLEAPAGAGTAEGGGSDSTGDDSDDSDADDAPAGAEQRPATSFGLLFQAPDPTPARRRPRRASSQPTDPSTIVRDEESGERADSVRARAARDAEREGVARDAERESGQARDDRAELDGTSTDETSADEHDTDENGTDERDAEQGEGQRSGRSRRRRGGRGRRARGADEGDDGATDSEGDQDEQDDDASDNGSGRGGRGGRGGNRADRADHDTDHDERDDTDEPDTEDGSGEDSGEDSGESRSRSRRSRNRRARKAADQPSSGPDDSDDSSDGGEGGSDEDQGSSRRRRRRRRSGAGGDSDDPPGTVTKVREPRRAEATGIKGSTRLEAKKVRRREGREAGRRRTIITEAEFLARRESVERAMVVRRHEDRTQIAVLEDGVLVEHYVSREESASSTSIAGNIYLGRVQNVLPSMEAAFVDIGKGRNAVLYAGEVNWDAAGLQNGQSRRIENALKSGQTVLVQATKDPIGHKGARLTSQISLPGRYLVYVPDGNMTGISRKLPDTERSRLKRILREVMPANAGVIVRTAAEGASEEELRADVARLTGVWEDIQAKAASSSTKAPALLHGEPDLTVRVIRDVFNEDFSSLVVEGEDVWQEVSGYVNAVAPDLAGRLSRWSGERDVFAEHRIDEQLVKAMDRKVWLPSGGSLVIDRTEAMTVIDVNTGKFVGAGGNLEETVTKNNLEAAEEIVRQLRLRDIGGIIVIDFIDMVLESNRDLVIRRLVECLGRDRTKHQVAEVTSLGLVQMTRKRVGTGLIESFSTICEHCNGRGIVIHAQPVGSANPDDDVPSGRDGGRDGGRDKRSRRGRGQDSGSANGSGNGSGHGGSGQGGSGQRNGNGQGNGHGQGNGNGNGNGNGEPRHDGPTPAQIAAAAHAAALQAAAVRRDGAESGAPLTDADVAAAIDSAVGAVFGEVLGDEQPGEQVSATASEQASEQAAEQAPEPAPEPEPAARPRRRRGRVVAPAGPPKATEGSTADLNAGQTTE